MIDRDYLDKVTPKQQPIASIRFPKKPGKELPNEAIILVETELRRYDFRRDSLVLTVVPGSARPFAIWTRTIGEEQKATGGWGVLDYCFQGDYFSTLEEAIDNFKHRYEVQMDRIEGLERIANDHA
jgi:hypothetical protein